MPTVPPPVISVLVADDDPTQRLILDRILQSAEGVEHRVRTVEDGASALHALGEEVFDVALLDLSMPGLNGLEVLEAVAGDPTRPSVVFVSGRGTVATATRAMKLGAYDFVEKPVDRERLLALVWKASEARRMQAKSERLGAVAQREATAGAHIVTRDPRMREALALLERVAPSEVSVLVVGESGTGKELVARELHRLSGREKEPLVALNCAAVSEALAESELFGHERGSFTGAAQRKMGLVEMADGGTLFLDEIGEMDAGLQAKLLRTLEGKTFRRVGGVKELPANFRLVSATNRALEERVGNGAFRQDLFYRINAVVVELPPLRERPDDVLLLARHFLAGARDPDGPTDISDEAAAILQGYRWPGNVRELRNVVERAALLCRSSIIRPGDLGSSLVLDGPVPDRRSTDPVSLPTLHLEDLEKRAVREALHRTSWHQGQAAEVLGVSARTLHRKIKAMGLRRPD
ncbi:MAG: sigma-54 dependent transcriptional regulator [Longimicrobiales bacterium]